MGETELKAEIERIIPLLYQNKGQAALEEVKALLAFFQEKMRNITTITEERKTFIVMSFKILLEAYQSHDMLAMADCLQEYGEKMVDVCK